MHSQKWGEKSSKSSLIGSLSQPTQKIIRQNKTLPLTSDPILQINRERIGLQIKYEKENFPSQLFALPVQRGKEFDAIQCLYNIYESSKKEKKTHIEFNSTFSATYIPYRPEIILIESSDIDECSSIIEEAINKTESIFLDHCMNDLRELNSAEIFDFFCYPIQFLSLHIGSIVRIKDPEFQNEPAQIVDVNCQTGNVMVKMYGHIDYDTLIQFNYTSQKALNLKMPNNYHANPAPFEESFFARHSAKFEIKPVNISMAPGGVTDMIFWDGNYYYEQFMYIEFPIKSIVTQNLNITEEEFQRFQDSRVPWEIINDSFVEHMNRTKVIKPNIEITQPSQIDIVNNFSPRPIQKIDTISDFNPQIQPPAIDTTSEISPSLSLQNNIIIDSSPLQRSESPSPSPPPPPSPSPPPLPSPSPPHSPIPKEKTKKKKTKTKDITDQPEEKKKVINVDEQPEDKKERKSANNQKEKKKKTKNIPDQTEDDNKVEEKKKTKKSEKSEKSEKDRDNDDKFNFLDSSNYTDYQPISSVNDVTVGSTGIIITRNLPCKVFKIFNNRIVVKPDPITVGGTIDAFKEVGKQELSQIERAKLEIEQIKTEKNISRATQTLTEEDQPGIKPRIESKAKRKINIHSILSESETDSYDYYSYDEYEEKPKIAKKKADNDNIHTTKAKKWTTSMIQTEVPTYRQYDLVEMKNGQIGTIVIPPNSYKLNVHLSTNKVLKDIKESDIDKIIPDQGYVTDKSGQQICLNDEVYGKNKKAKTVIRMHNKRLFVHDLAESNPSYEWIDADETVCRYVSLNFPMESENSLIGKTVHRISNGINSKSFKIEAVSKKGYLMAAGKIKFKFNEIGKTWDFDR